MSSTVRPGAGVSRASSRRGFEMDRRRFVIGAFAAAAIAPALPTASAQETPPAPPEPAPTPAPTAAPPAAPKAVLIANAASGFEAPLADKHLKALFRGMVQSTPAGQRVLFYLMPAHSEAQNLALEEIMGWTESNFERQMPIIESQMARLMYKRMPGATEVITAVANDPGGVGVVPGDLSLPPTVMVLWSSGGAS